MTIEERLEIIRETLKQGWSSHYAFRMGKVSRKEMPYFRERLADEILAYNKTRHNYSEFKAGTK